MLGAIIGDIAGSRYEFKNYRKKDFEIFHPDCFLTDDTVMTLAIAKAILDTRTSIKSTKAAAVSLINEDYLKLLSSHCVKSMQEYGNLYPYMSYGGRFGVWLSLSAPKPYGSFGNGAAMRVSPVAYVAKSPDDVKKLSRAVTEVTHNHPEGIKGAEATAMAIYTALNGASIKDIDELIERSYYKLPRNIDEIRKTYRFNESCQGTVPQAITAFLESNSFEDSIRTAVSLGGDSDTLAAITGSIAEAYYGVPDDMAEKAVSCLDDRLLSLYRRWVATF